MTNNSGKFRTAISHKAADAQNTGGGDNGNDEKNTKFPQFEAQIPETGMNERLYSITSQIPSVPQDTMSKVKYYLGEWWWLWLIAIVLYFANKK